MGVARLLTVASAALAVGAAPATAAITFGSDLEDQPSAGLGNNETVVTRTVAFDHMAPGGPTAPMNGVVVRWRIRAAAGSDAFEARFRLLRGNQSVARGPLRSVPETPNSGHVIYEFSERIAVGVGDALGVDHFTVGGNADFMALGAGTVDVWTPALFADESRTPTFDNENLQLLVNADIEPDTDGDGFGDETQDACPAAAGSQAPCPASAAPPDTTPPDTTIDSGPKSRIRKRRVSFRFSANEPGATFECALDRGGFKPCRSPKRYRRLRIGRHTFRVRAIDKVGLLEPGPARRAFRVLRRRR